MYKHMPVMLNEVIEGLKIKENGIYVDLTMGGAGHASEILKKIKGGWLYCFEQDPYAKSEGEKKLAEINANFSIFPLNFANVKSSLNEVGITKVDGILFDLGVSSFQLDIPERGFSYRNDGVLDMRMDPKNTLTAKKIVNEYSFHELKRIFEIYGEEKFSLMIARNIEKVRNVKPIETTFELVEIIKNSLPAKVLKQKGHPAKQVFQALRIEVNKELDVFKIALQDCFDLLNPNGRIAVLTFHSLEDRICKKLFNEKVEVNIPSKLPIKETEIKRNFRLINKKVIIASQEELERNNRAHSAKLRIIEKI